MQDESSRDSNESSGSFQRALDSLKNPIYDPIEDIQKTKPQKILLPSILPPSAKIKRPTKYHHRISLTTLRQASMTMTMERAARDFKVSKSTIVKYSRLFGVVWSSKVKIIQNPLETDSVTLSSGTIITKQVLLNLEKKYLQKDAAKHLGISKDELRKICKKLEKGKWQSKVVAKTSAPTPTLTLEDLLRMETEMTCLEARKILGLNPNQFRRYCYDRGMVHRWNHRKAKVSARLKALETASNPQAPPPPPQSPL